MGEFDGFYAEFEKRGESFFSINEKYLIMQVHQIPYPYFPVVFFAVSQNPYQSNIYISLIYHSPEYLDPKLPSESSN